MPEELQVKATCSLDKSIYDMVEISEAIDEIIDLVHSDNQIVALAIKQSITDKMLDWIDGKEE